MHRFFERPDAVWRKPSGCLHFYALPTGDSEVANGFRRTADALSAVPGLGRMPEQYLHATVQRLDAYVEDLADPAWTSALDAIGTELRRQQPFAIEFAAPSPRSHAVEAVGVVSPQWELLVATLRRALTDHGLESALATPPYAPHFTVSYCLEETPDSDIDQALARVATPSVMELTALSLVAVDQKPVEGFFSFVTIREWKLGQ